MRLVGSIVTVLLVTAGWTRVEAQDVPADVADDAQGLANAELPPIPDGYQRERRGGVEWVYPESAAAVAGDLQDTYDEAWPRIVDELGGDVGADLVIRIGRNPDEMEALAPRGEGIGRPPEYASGVAYPGLGVVLLTLTAPESWQRPPVDAVLAHELSHIALSRSVAGRPLPRWFMEGTAILQAREGSFTRTQTLWEATVRGKLIPLRRLSRSFPARPHEVSLAYAQSADFVGYLRDGEEGSRRFTRLVTNLRSGDPFDRAVRRAYGVSLGVLESRWRDALAERYQTLPLVLTGGGLWVLVIGLLGLAWWRKRRDKRKKLRQWADEDEAFTRAERALDVTALPPPPPPSRNERVVIVVPGDPPQGREPGVPTIEHEGRNHTLH